MSENLHFKPLVIEIVGPAGAGKTSITNVLVEKTPGINLHQPPCDRNLRELPLFLHEGIKLMPVLAELKRLRAGRQITRSEFARMCILNGWSQMPNFSSNGKASVALLDEGPIFLMTELLYFGPDSFRSEYMQAWWQATYRKWAKCLDLVIFLDADNDELVRRIRARSKWHSIKTRTDANAFHYLDFYRSTQQQILEGIKSQPEAPEALSFDTTTTPPEIVIQQIMKKLRPYLRTSQSTPTPVAHSSFSRS
jgi:deoxyadenosine/deoxycytidine kinase